MSQITIYLPDAVEREIRQRAEKARKSVSAFFAELALKTVSPKKWPAKLNKLYGSWEGSFPTPADEPPKDDVLLD